VSKHVSKRQVRAYARLQVQHEALAAERGRRDRHEVVLDERHGAGHEAGCDAHEELRASLWSVAQQRTRHGLSSPLEGLEDTRRREHAPDLLPRRGRAALLPVLAVVEARRRAAVRRWGRVRR
jgi:hypothetical protein